MNYSFKQVPIHWIHFSRAKYHVYFVFPPAGCKCRNKQRLSPLVLNLHIIGKDINSVSLQEISFMWSPVIFRFFFLSILMRVNIWGFLFYNKKKVKYLRQISITYSRCVFECLGVECNISTIRHTLTRSLYFFLFLCVCIVCNTSFEYWNKLRCVLLQYNYCVCLSQDYITIYMTYSKTLQV